MNTDQSRKYIQLFLKQKIIVPTSEKESTVNTDAIKETLFKHCLDYVNAHIETNRNAFEQAQESALSETKTVASEEPETGKERSQREMETIGQRLEEITGQREILQSLEYRKKFTCVEPGALVATTVGAFFIAMSADEVEIDGVEYCPISLTSPIGMALRNKKAGESVLFREKKIKIENIW